MGKYSRRRRSRSSGGDNGGAWLMTYGDMMTLLLTFFVLLYTFSSLNVTKFQAVLYYLKDALGLLEGGTTLSIDIDPSGMMGDMNEEWQKEQMQLEELQNELQAFIEKEELQGQVVVTMEERGLVIRLYDSVLFDLGSADLKQVAKGILDKIGEALEELPNQVRAEGHTDDLPISTYRYPSNWELSTARATSVIRYMVEELHFSPLKFSAAGYGEYRPIAPNQPGGQPLNRRVDLVILRNAGEDREPLVYPNGEEEKAE